MNEHSTHSGLEGHIQHLFQFDGLLHWCFWLAVIIFIIGLIWVTWRILWPLRQLSQQARSIINGDLPSFEQKIRGIPEIEHLRSSLAYMVDEIRAAQKRDLLHRQALTDSQENERKRIARDIHDDTIQSLVVVSHHLERALNTPKQAPHLKNARSQLLNTIEGLRHMIANLRPTVLDELGLVVALELLSEQHPHVHYTLEGTPYELEYGQELGIFRAAQEILWNAERHAHAEQITMRLCYADGGLTLSVEDDGKGFVVPRKLQDFATHGHYGLLGIQERMVSLGGTVELSSQVGQGTRISIHLPTILAVQLAA